MQKNIPTNYITEEKIRIISNQEIAYDLLELSEMLVLPVDTCMLLLFQRLTENNNEVFC